MPKRSKQYNNEPKPWEMPTYDRVDPTQPNHELKIKKITPKNESQAYYMSKINGTSITFGIGPAGTGKTWLAAVMAAQALKNGHIDKIIVTRPAVEVGESLGFLPGELEEKYEPYLRPVKDAFIDALGAGQTEYYIKQKRIEARPLQFLRGATLKDCWTIADEMQNSTPGEMKMFLTRFGEGGKYIINGDIKQKDIAGPSGLVDALYKLNGLRDVAICNFSHADIVRHGIVRDIIGRYEGSEGYFEDQEGLQRFLQSN
jgi:phosphate starvation-inducible PhoH-like protein